MSETGVEFTGERVVPELVDVDLFNEHLARYRFARRFAAGLGASARILDAGCGLGYGTAELPVTARRYGADISEEAVGEARRRYGRAGVSFLPAACEALPFADGVFDLMTAFEVIEHLGRRQEMLAEAHRVLKPSGILLVSTPNRAYYAESRGDAGPNPFHVHEYDLEEFTAALEAVFPHVRIWTQNHEEAIVFSPRGGTGGALEARAADDAANAHFYLAACSRSPIPHGDAKLQLSTDAIFAWFPSNANILRERERHIAKLKAELKQKEDWLRKAIAEHAELQANHEALTAELERQNAWAAELNREVSLRDARIGELQSECEVRLAWVRDVEAQLERARTEIARLNAETVEIRSAARAHIDHLEGVVAELESVVTERTLWAQRLDVEIAGYRAEIQRLASSRWFRAGAKLGLGPRLRDTP